MLGYRCLFPLAAATTLISTMAPAQNWQTVDDFSGTTTNAEAHGVAVDSTGGIYVVGTADGHAVIRYSGDAGSTWSTRNDFVYPSESNNVFNAITIDTQGTLYVGGSSHGRGLRWMVRRSADHGITWQTVDDFYTPMIDPIHPGTNGAVYSLSRDSHGRVYGAGLMQLTGPSYEKWCVRGSDIGGTNWDTKLLLDSGYAGVSQLTCAGEDVYVTGATSDTVVNTGFILGSSDHGATWSTNFESTNEFFPAVTSDSAGNAYFGGSISTNSNSSYSYAWLLRKGMPGTSNWTTLDQFSSSGSPTSLTVDAAGNICVAGHTADSSWSWLTRQYLVATGQWSTTDLFSYSTNQYVNAVPTGTAIAPDGSTFVVGYGTSNSGQRHWLVRKRGGPPRLQIAVGIGGVIVSWPVDYTNATLQWSDCGASQIWHTCTNTVNLVGGRNTTTFDLASGPRIFRLKPAASP